MNDLISRQAVLDYIDSMPSELTNDGRRMIRRIRLTEYISDTLPSAQRKGKWIDDVYRDFTCVCSECGVRQEIKAKFLFSYCPNCGASMEWRGEEDAN